MPYACAVWNSFSTAAAKWFTFLDQEISFLSISQTYICVLKDGGQNDFTSYDDNG